MKTGPKPRSTEEVRKIIQSYGCDLVGEYVGSKIKIRVRCPCGNIREAFFNDFIRTTDSHRCKECSGAKITTKQARIILSKFDCELVGEYVNPKIKIEIVCPKCKSIFPVFFHTFIKRIGEKVCPKCKTPNHSLKEDKKEEYRKKVFDLGFIILEEYIKNKKWRMIIEDRARYKYDAIPSDILKRKNSKRINIASPDNPFSLYNISLWLKINNKTFYLTEDNTYINSTKSKLRFYCNICDDYFYSRWDDISQGWGCHNCEGRIISDKNNLLFVFPDVAKEWHSSKNGDLLPRDVSDASHLKVWWQCQYCGNEWPAEIGSRTRGNGCPACSSSGGEKRIKRFLVENNIFFIPQYRFSDCKNKRELPFDFAIFNDGVLFGIIEAQGIQHFESVPYFGGEKSYLSQLERDFIKKEYCNKNGISLLEIEYWNFKNVNSILTEYLNL